MRTPASATGTVAICPPTTRVRFQCQGCAVGCRIPATVTAVRICSLERAGHQQGDAEADGAEERQGALHDCVDPDLIASQLEQAASARRADDATQVAERDRLRELLLELPQKQRRALVLATYFGRTAKEISALDGTPVGTVKTPFVLAQECEPAWLRDPLLVRKG